MKDKIKHKENCPNKNCWGGVIHNTGKICLKCNPEYKSKKQDYETTGNPIDPHLKTRYKRTYN